MWLKFFKKKLDPVVSSDAKMNQVNSEVAFEDQKRLLNSIKNIDNELVVFDVGANEGLISLTYQKYFTRLKLFAFEPFPDSYNRLKATSEIARYICPLNLAVSNYTGKKKFFCNSNNETNSLLESCKLNSEIDDLIKTVNTIEVDTITIDDVVKQYGISQIDVLKMDIQGGELDALKGAVETLRRGRVSIIYIEIEFVHIYENQPLFLDIANFLNNYNFGLYSFYNFNYIKGQLAWADALFINKNIFKDEVLS